MNKFQAILLTFKLHHFLMDILCVKITTWAWGEVKEEFWELEREKMKQTLKKFALPSCPNADATVGLWQHHVGRHNVKERTEGIFERE